MTSNACPYAIPVGSQILHAAGIAWAANIKKEKMAVICYFGDGATSRGDFHEGLNFASVFNLPAVFICSNNQFAISTPVIDANACKTIAQKAIAYGMRGYRLDGMDVLAVLCDGKGRAGESKKRRRAHADRSAVLPVRPAYDRG